MDRVLDEPFAAAEMVAVCAAPTAAILAVKDAALEEAATVTAAGMLMALLLLARATVNALGDLVANETVHVVLPAAAKDVFAHDKARKSGVSTAGAEGDKEIENDFTMLP